jgi:hypothetical protein
MSTNRASSRKIASKPARIKAESACTSTLNTDLAWMLLRYIVLLPATVLIALRIERWTVDTPWNLNRELHRSRGCALSQSRGEPSQSSKPRLAIRG